MVEEDRLSLGTTECVTMGYTEIHSDGVTEGSLLESIDDLAFTLDSERPSVADISRKIGPLVSTIVSRREKKESACGIS